MYNKETFTYGAEIEWGDIDRRRQVPDHLYLTSLVNGVIITSTADIPKRAGIKMPAVEVPMNTYLTFDENMTMNVEVVPTESKDLQKVDYETETVSN